MGDIEFDPSTDKPDFKHISYHKAINFCYSGGLHLDRSKSLLSICQVLKKLNTNKNFTLSIYSKELDWLKCGREFDEFNFVKYMGFVKSEEILERLIKALKVSISEFFNSKEFKK